MTTSVLTTDIARPKSVTVSVNALKKIVMHAVNGAIVLFIAATLVFIAQIGLPGDRATIILNINSGQAVERTAEELAPINELFGFNDPLISQYAHYVGGLFRGDLGLSYQYYSPVTEVIAGQLLPTLQLTFGALVISWIIMLVTTPLFAGRRKGIRNVTSAAESFSASLPIYWVAVLLLVVFAVNLRWFPVMGGTDLRASILPMIALAIPLAGFLAQTTRDEFERTLGQPFVTAIRMRGASDLSLRIKNVLRHALIAPITLSGWAIGSLFSGAVLVESVFSRPGIGQLLINAVNTRDIPVVAGVVMLVALIYVLANIAVDALYLLVDPRRRAA